MMIKYNGNNVHALGELSSNPAGTNQAPQNIHFFRPGWNEFPQRVWDAYKDDAEIKRMVKDGLFEFLNQKVVVTEGRKKVTKVLGADDAQVSLMELPEGKAIEVAKGTMNRDMLQRWLDEETRHKVKRALSKQIEPLLSNEKEEDDSE